MTDTGRHIIIEMQRAEQSFFSNRILTYSSRVVSSEAMRGDMEYNIPTVISFNIMDYDSNEFNQYEDAFHIVKLKDEKNAVYSEIDSKLDSLSILNRVTILGEVPSCENWYELEVSKISTGNAITISNLYWETGLFADIDPGFLFDFQNNFEYCVTDSSFNEQWGPQQIHACEAWHLTTGTSSVKVAVIDQGVDVQHRELKHVLRRNGGEVVKKIKPRSGNPGRGFQIMSGKK